MNIDICLAPFDKTVGARGDESNDYGRVRFGRGLRTHRDKGAADAG